VLDRAARPYRLALLPVLVPAAASAQSSVHYVALGDSYSAGLGAGSYLAASGSCDRSRNAYPARWAAANHPASYTAETCSGATTASVISTQLSALSTATTLVSITVGGNDVGFSSVMETCVLSPASSCASAVHTAEGLIAAALPARLDHVLAGIRAAARNARVVVLGYPQLYDLGGAGHRRVLPSDRGRPVWRLPPGIQPAGRLSQARAGW
jgi:lysophospholipase L1-like esterase